VQSRPPGGYHSPVTVWSDPMGFVWLGFSLPMVLGIEIAVSLHLSLDFVHLGKPSTLLSEAGRNESSIKVSADGDLCDGDRSPPWTALGNFSPVANPGWLARNPARQDLALGKRRPTTGAEG
jgi:hypothetical protein